MKNQKKPKKNFIKIASASVLLALSLSCQETDNNAINTASNEAITQQSNKATVVANVDLLPKYLAFGFRNGPGQVNLIKSLKVNYRYQYLSGGVNTSSNWKTWNTPTADFARLYLNDSEANGIIPIFSYYQIIGSNPKPYTEPHLKI